MQSGLRPVLLLLLLAIGVAISTAQDAKPQTAVPRYTAEGQLLYPENYREWVYLSSGLGMTYSGGRGQEPQFTNVFVTSAAYREFLAAGKWPDKTVFVVEERDSATRGSINKGGRYQGELMGLAVEVKDETRFREKWAYFNFGPAGKPAKANPKSVCWECHEGHAAVEHSFVQFYPTLVPVAKKFGVYRDSAAASR